MTHTNGHTFSPQADYMTALIRRVIITNRGYIQARANEIRAADDDCLDCCIGDSQDMGTIELSNYAARKQAIAERDVELVDVDHMIGWERWTVREMARWQRMKYQAYQSMRQRTPQRAVKGQWLQEFEDLHGINRDNYEFDEDEFNEFKQERRRENISSLHITTKPQRHYRCKRNGLSVRGQKHLRMA